MPDKSVPIEVGQEYRTQNGTAKIMSMSTSSPHGLIECRVDVNGDEEIISYGDITTFINEGSWSLKQAN